MLEIAASSSPTTFDDNIRPPKRRRIAGRVVISQEDQDGSALIEKAASETPDDVKGAINSIHSTNLKQQVAYDDSDNSTESDMAWEEVDLKDTVKNEDTTPEPGELNLVLGGNKDSTSRYTAPKRKPLTAEERRLRLEIHKMHLLSLLVHVHLRNHWCNDRETQVCTYKDRRRGKAEHL